MTAKHYKAIAEIISNGGYKYLYRKALSNKLADFFVTDNPRFDRKRFLMACGLNS